MTGGLFSVLDALEAGPLAGRVQRDAPIGELTTYRVGGVAAALIVLGESSDVEALADGIRGREVDVVAIGRGSNLLVSDDGFNGIIVSLGSGFAEVTVAGPVVTAGAAAKLPVVARAAVSAGLIGFEWAVGVPGSIGGAVRMNAGGHGAEMSDSLTEAHVFDLRAGTAQWRSADQLHLDYRSSALARSDLVLGARLELAPGDPEQGRLLMSEIVQWRRENQPGGQNAGSVFTNPAGDSAGRLIDEAGLKGFRIGSAEVSAKHANFIQADSDGRAADIRSVMIEVQRRVKEVHGVELHAETEMLGFDSPEHV
jgi:UDP-N-acetylmuramate dehydrogenase